jgi:hypothetical protein
MDRAFLDNLGCSQRVDLINDLNMVYQNHIKILG